MKNLFVIVLLSLIVIDEAPDVMAASYAEAPSGQTCEYLVNPIGIDEPVPRLSWIINDSRRGAIQSAYRILVSDNLDKLAANQGTVWDSGKVDSDQSIQIPYAGTSLKSGVRYHWKVRVWDAAGNPSPFSKPSFWQMGLMQKSGRKASWIGFGGLLPKPQRRHNGYHSQISNAPDTVKWIVIDLGEPMPFDAIRLYPAHPFNWKDTPGFLYPLRFRIDVSNHAGFQSFDTILDKTQEDIINPKDSPQRYSFASVTARYVRLYVTKLAVRDEQNYGLALAEMQVLTENDNIALEKTVTGLDSVNDDSWSLDRLTDGVTKPVDPGKTWTPHPSPMLRKEFRLPAPIKSAALSVTALGLYEFYINGHRIGKNILAPEWTDYHTRIQYQTYDVTSELCEGDNALGALLGEGWYAGRVGLVNAFRIYGDRLALLAQLDIVCTDGSRHTVVSDATWRGTMDGPIRGSDIFHGEIYDTRRGMPGWDSPGYDDSQWGKADVLTPPETQLSAQVNEPIKITEDIQPVSVSEPKPNVFVYDLGQNIVGWCSLTAKGSPGTVITLRYAEVLNPDGTVYTDNLRGPYQVDKFILDGSENCRFEPHFTYHGFRYIEITGLDKPLPLDTITGHVFHSASPFASSFECSDPTLNKLMKNILWTLRGNMHSTPTDCPQRDERMGWMGDAQIFSQAACFNMNVAAFYTKWLQDIRDAQTPDGQYSDFCPNPLMKNGQFVAAPAWADAGVIIPWRMYVNYGDTRILERHYDSMTRWVDYVQKNSTGFIWTQGRGNDYGDWLNADTLILEDWPKKGAEISKEQIATAFAAHSADLLSRIAGILKKDTDSKKYISLFENIRNAYVQKYFDKNGRNIEDNQTAYALALYFDLIPSDWRPKAAEHIVRKINDYRGHLSTGIQATNRMMLELADEGRADAAYQLLNQRTIPSWGYMADHGATTIWERWDGWVENRGFQNPGMNSFNHYALGAVSEWVFRNIAGINPDPAEPAYKHIRIQPRPGGGLTHAKASYHSIRGTIATEWSINNTMFSCIVTVPPNTHASIIFPAGDGSQITENQRPLKECKQVTIASVDENEIVLTVPSGTYEFSMEASLFVQK